MTTKDGGPAFPSRHGHTGMSLRDWFAGMAMQALITKGYSQHWGVISERAHAIADAMLAEREKE